MSDTDGLMGEVVNGLAEWKAAMYRGDICRDAADWQRKPIAELCDPSSSS